MSLLNCKRPLSCLKEVVVTDSLEGGRDHAPGTIGIEQNYPMERFQLEGFYRDLKKLGGTYISLLEALLKSPMKINAEPRNKVQVA